MLNRNDPIPLYVQLTQHLKNSIIKGEYANGELLPSESQMMKEYRTTRGTVRRAIRELVNESLVRREHGKGTFVSLGKVKYSMWSFNGYTDYVTKKGKTPVSSVISQKIARDADGAEYFFLKRKRGVKENNEVVILTIDCSKIPLSKFPNIETIDFAKASLYQVMKERYQISPQRVDMVISPLNADEESMHLFGVPSGTALLKAEGIVYCNQNEPVEQVSVIYSPNVEFRIASDIPI